VPIHNEGLREELEYITQPGEREKIGKMFEAGRPIMHDIAYNLIVGNNHEVDRLTKAALEEGFPANDILDQGLISAMAIVGVKFRDNIIFVPEVLVAARAMKAGMAHLEPILSTSGVKPAGTVIMGTVKGDLHDIGKNLCIMMLRGSGFVVHDLGVDTKPDEFIEAILEYDAGVLGMSALLITTMPNMGKTVEAIEEAGLRDKVRIMVGGAPLNQQFADEMGADGYAKDAISCVELARQLLDGAETPQPVAPIPE
jgi:5-methyltetrahydrofolate--homocysteine methyltransferase